MEPIPGKFRPLDAAGVLSWVHFGDLHLTTEHAPNYQDLLALIADANTYLRGPEGVNFALLPGDNADNGTEAQYRILRRALEQLYLPLHALPGDHDIQSGTLEDFRRFLEPGLPKSFVAGAYRCVFLNSVDIEGKEGFGHRPAQLAFLANELAAADQAGERVVLFMHTYPSELGDAAGAVTRAIHHHHGVRVVEMGHTHYNEIANDGRVIYAATRSTGQIEEGPVGFSVTCLDRDVVSWKFKALAEPWPLVMITSPADQAFLTASAHPARGSVQVHAKVWGRQGGQAVFCQVDDGPPEPMFRTDGALWRWWWDTTRYPDGPHRLTVRARNSSGQPAEDSITVLCAQGDSWSLPPRAPVDRDNAIGAYPSKGILGTQLGPNQNGHPW